DAIPIERGCNKTALFTCRSAATRPAHFHAGIPSPAAYHSTLAPPSLPLSAPGSSPGILRPVPLIELVDVPQHIRFNHRRMEIPDALFRADQNIRAGQENH